jgi:uncharacterized protein YlxP (DUF503 family)
VRGEITMHVGALEVRLHVPEADSLKDKRQVVRSILDRMRNHFHVAAAEVEEQDVHRTAVLGFACVSGSHQHAAEVMAKVLEALRVHPVARVIDHVMDVL